MEIEDTKYLTSTCLYWKWVGPQSDLGGTVCFVAALETMKPWKSGVKHGDLGMALEFKDEESRFILFSSKKCVHTGGSLR